MLGWQCKVHGSKCYRALPGFFCFTDQLNWRRHRVNQTVLSSGVSSSPSLLRSLIIQQTKVSTRHTDFLFFLKAVIHRFSVSLVPLNHLKIRLAINHLLSLQRHENQHFSLTDTQNTELGPLQRKLLTRIATLIQNTWCSSREAKGSTPGSISKIGTEQTNTFHWVFSVHFHNYVNNNLQRDYYLRRNEYILIKNTADIGTDSFTLKDETDRQSRNVGTKPPYAA
jgi:hypothetical protein